MNVDRFLFSHFSVLHTIILKKPIARDQNVYVENQQIRHTLEYN